MAGVEEGTPGRRQIMDESPGVKITLLRVLNVHFRVVLTGGAADEEGKSPDTRLLCLYPTGCGIIEGCYRELATSDLCLQRSSG